MSEIRYNQYSFNLDGSYTISNVTLNNPSDDERLIALCHEEVCSIFVNLLESILKRKGKVINVKSYEPSYKKDILDKTAKVIESYLMPRHSIVIRKSIAFQLAYHTIVNIAFKNKRWRTMYDCGNEITFKYFIDGKIQLKDNKAPTRIKLMGNPSFKTVSNNLMDKCATEKIPKKYLACNYGPSTEDNTYSFDISLIPGLLIQSIEGKVNPINHKLYKKWFNTMNTYGKNPTKYQKRIVDEKVFRIIKALTIKKGK